MLLEVTIKYVTMIRNTASFAQRKFSNCNLSVPVIHISYTYCKFSFYEIFYVYRNSLQIQQNYLYNKLQMSERDAMRSRGTQGGRVDLPRNKTSESVKDTESLSFSLLEGLCHFTNFWVVPLWQSLLVIRRVPIATWPWEVTGVPP